MDNIKRELSGEDAQDRIQWRRLIRNIDPTQSGKGCKRRRRIEAVVLSNIPDSWNTSSFSFCGGFLGGYFDAISAIALQRDKRHPWDSRNV